MSLNALQLVTLIDDNCGTNSTSYPTAKKVVDINLAYDKALSIIIQASGAAQFDDSEHTADPIITFNLISGQSDYHYTTDEQGNLILDIYRVMVANASGVFYDLEVEDQQSRGQAMGIVDGQGKTGTPTKYDKTGNAIYLDLAPNYNYTNGIKLFINREASYFVVLDTFYTTKKPGFAGLFHEYLALRPSYMYAYRKGLSNAKVLQTEMLMMEDAIEEYYSKHMKDEPTQIKTKNRSSR